MRESPTVKLQIVIVLMNFVPVTRQSIAGITYHDEFDFDEKYRNIHECDPFYWHPLHLPEQCAEMFADLIRSRVTATVKRPVRVVTRRRRPGFSRQRAAREDIYSLRHYYKYFEPEYEQPMYDNDYNYDNHNDCSKERYKDEEITYVRPPHLSPYEKMLEFLRQDVEKNPTAPVIAMSNYGPVAMYQQPISKQSKNIINKLTRAYVRSSKATNKDDDGYYYGKIELPGRASNNYKDESSNTYSETKKLKKHVKKTNIFQKTPKSKKHRGSLTIQ